YEGSDDNLQNNSTMVARNQLGDDFYRPALDEDGQYRTSKTRGMTLNLNSGINISLFEKDLMRLSQDSFSTENHFIQEGQYLSEDLVKDWLQRESEDNPEGLNPPEGGGDGDRVTNVLNSILEFDFFTESEDGLQLSGISIGLALNSVDYYQTEQFGSWLSQEISSEEVLKQGQEAANKIVSRIRAIE